MLASSRPSAHDRRATAIIGALLYLGFSMLIQIESFALFMHRPADGWSGVLAFAAQLPFRQAEHLAFAMMLGALAIPMCRWRPGRFAYVALFGLVLLYLVVDQIAFLTFFGHFELSMIDGRADLVAARDSILTEIPPTFAPNVLVWIVVVAAMARRIWGPAASAVSVPAAGWRGRYPRRTVAAGVAGFMGVSLVVMAATPASPLDRAAIPVLVRSLFASTTEPLQPMVPDPDLYRLRFGEATPAADTAGLDTMFSRVRQAAPRPNIVLVIMESVGAGQLFPPDGLSPSITPTLSRMSDRIVSFENLYNVFPASLRGHLPINTGGRTITWSNFSGPAADRYQGPVLVRELKKSGYRTALVSAQLFVLENFEPFYRSLGFDRIYEPTVESNTVRASRDVSSWGIDEDLARQRALEWIDESEARQPFFVQFLTVSTHHPYLTPKDYKGPVPGTGNQAQYYNAISYVDRVLGTLIEDLDTRGLLEDTVIAITGDHGQAFGDIHPGNFYHQGHLYEENIRNFLVVLGAPVAGQGRRVSRVGLTGDIMPTLVSLAGGDPGDVLGQNLFAPDYTERVAFFHKATAPRRWGLRDGRWKFSSSMTNTKDAELYDLLADPQEQDNLASQFPQRIQAYQRACRQWYVETDREYTTRVEGYSEPDLRQADLLTPGPKRVTFGSINADGVFQELPTINPREDVVARTRWVPWPEGKRVFFRWTSPSGRETAYSVLVKGGWGETWVYSEIIEPMEPGPWRLVIADPERELISAVFQVSEQAPLFMPMDPEATGSRPPTGRR